VAAAVVITGSHDQVRAGGAQRRVSEMFQAVLEDDVGRDERAGNPAGGGQPRPASRGRISMKSIPGEAARDPAP